MERPRLGARAWIERPPEKNRRAPALREELRGEETEVGEARRREERHRGTTRDVRAIGAR
ncbi:hypothetical protein BE11_38005 [Sorangium cellulosum]|nr:hypothetical protein BE11_38005 [Sorangium cellulosum]